MEIVRLSAALGAEIRGVNASRPIDDAMFARIRDAWHQHLVILLRDQDLDEEQQVRFAERFGPLSPIHTDHPRQRTSAPSAWGSSAAPTQRIVGGASQPAVCAKIKACCLNAS